MFLAGGAQRTQALAEKATMPPLGIAAGILAPATLRCELPSRVSALFGDVPAWSNVKEGAEPASASAETPSIADPERKKAVSGGPGISAADGAQPAEAETKVELAEQLEHGTEPIP